MSDWYPVVEPTINAVQIVCEVCAECPDVESSVGAITGMITTVFVVWILFK